MNRIDATSWTGRADYADDFRIVLRFPRVIERWFCQHAAWVVLPTLIAHSGYRAHADCRGWFYAFGYRCNAEEGEIAYWVFDEGCYRNHTALRYFDR